MRLTPGVTEKTLPRARGEKSFSFRELEQALLQPLEALAQRGGVGPVLVLGEDLGDLLPRQTLVDAQDEERLLVGLQGLAEPRQPVGGGARVGTDRALPELIGELRVLARRQA